MAIKEFLYKLHLVGVAMASPYWLGLLPELCRHSLSGGRKCLCRRGHFPVGVTNSILLIFFT